MFEQGNWDERTDELQGELTRLEGLVSRIRGRQVQILRQLDKFQIDTAAGARTMGDWAAAHLDLSHQTSTRLMTVANADDPEIEANLASGKWGLDRASLLVKLRQAAADPELFTEAAERYSLGRLYGLVDKLRHLLPADEQVIFEYRYLVVQPNLDESAFKLCSSTGRVARGRWFGEQASRTGGGARPVGNVTDKLHLPLRRAPFGARHLPPSLRSGGGKSSSTLLWPPHRLVSRVPPSLPDPEWVPTPSLRSSAPAKSE